MMAAASLPDRRAAGIANRSAMMNPVERFYGCGFDYDSSKQTVKRSGQVGEVRCFCISLAPHAGSQHSLVRCRSFVQVTRHSLDSLLSISLIFTCGRLFSLVFDGRIDPQEFLNDRQSYDMAVDAARRQATLGGIQIKHITLAAVRAVILRGRPLY